MKVFLITIWFFLIGSSLWGQHPERKLIIENDRYTYVTVNDNYQLATLYRGNINEPLREAVRYQLPLGRNLTAQLNPLAWDLTGDSIVAINFMDHVLNDRYESIKKIGVKGLEKWHEGIDIGSVMNRSVELPSYVLNQPYLFVKEQSDILNHFYFDLVVIDQALWLVMSNNGSYVVWKYDGQKWEQSKVFEKTFRGYFTLIEKNQEPFLILSDGEMLKIALDKITVEQTPTANFELKDVVLVSDRDKGQHFFLKMNLLSENASMKDLLGKAKQLF